MSARTGAASVIGHAHTGVCAGVAPSRPLTSVGAHWNYDTDQPYGVEANEIWYTSDAGDFGSLSFKTPMKDWELPGADGQLPNKLILPANSTSPPVFRGAKGFQGNVPGAVVLHRVEDDGSAGEALACCALTYSADFCASIGGCSVYDPRTDPSTLGLARSPGVGQPFGYVSPPTFGEAGIYS
ncbi:MAG: hypothetical protein VX563_00855, partial [Planctomycetota bacterium]|nr:hypothetical protein [Planctomycetota bacterium]